MTFTWYLTTCACQVLALEMLILMLDRPSADSVELAGDFVKEVGAYLQDVASQGLHRWDAWFSCPDCCGLCMACASGLCSVGWTWGCGTQLVLCAFSVVITWIIQVTKGSQSRPRITSRRTTCAPAVMTCDLFICCFTTYMLHARHPSPM